MAEANHCYMSAARSDVDIFDVKLSSCDPISDDAPVNRVNPLDVIGDHLPAFGHCTLDHLVHAQIGRVSLRIQSVIGFDDGTEPLRSRLGAIRDAAELCLDLAHGALGDSLVYRPLRGEEPIDVRRT